jgi:hypothetical protein
MMMKMITNYDDFNDENEDFNDDDDDFNDNDDNHQSSCHSTYHLSLGQHNPQSAPCRELELVREQKLHLLGGVAR